MVNVTRNRHRPRFLNESYSATVRQDKGAGNMVVQLTAADNDLKVTTLTCYISLLCHDSSVCYEWLSIICLYVNMSRQMSGNFLAPALNHHSEASYDHTISALIA